MGRFTVCWSLLVLCLLVGPVRAGVEEPDHRPAGAGDGHQGDAHLSVALPDSPPLLQSTTVPPAPSSLCSGCSARLVCACAADELAVRFDRHDCQRSSTKYAANAIDARYISGCTCRQWPLSSLMATNVRNP